MSCLCTVLHSVEPRALLLLVHPERLAAQEPTCPLVARSGRASRPATPDALGVNGVSRSAATYQDPADLAAFRPSHGDDELSLGVSFSLVPKRFGNLTQLVAPFDDRRDPFSLDELLQNRQILPVVPHDEHPHPLA